MEKTAIKNYAIWARRKLKEEIATRAGFLGITENGIRKPLEASTGEIQYFDIGADKPVSIRGKEIGQREIMVRKLTAAADRTDYRQAYEQLIETSAYDWFNRLIAIRYMEVNEYEPLDVRLLSSIEDGKQDPDLVTTPFDGSLEYTEEERKQIIEWKSRNESEKLFRFLLLKMCNELHSALPGIFQQQGDYSELLMRFSFVDKDGVLYRLVHDIPEEDWKEQVQIIGWIYQYYNTELKDETFALLKKNVKITRERIPSATQLFTPDWIVRYMVENSLGRLWLEGHPDDSLKANWRYYLDEAPQDPEVEAQLAEIRREYAKLEPEDLKCIDPCMGSGHILVYMFDVLMKIYVSVGYSEREAAKSILEHNLYGLDIDDRAYQLAYFAVMMKARKHNRLILSSGIKPHVYAIAESNSVDKETVEYFSNRDEKLEAALDTILAEMKDAKEYGSILNVTPQDWDAIHARVEEIEEDTGSVFRRPALEVLLPVLQVAEALAQKYDVVVTNPPYMNPNISANLNEYVKKNYPDSKSDLFAVFMEKCRDMVKAKRYFAMINQHSWMFLSSYEKLRRKIVQINIVNMIHLGARAFEEIGGEVVQTTSFVMRDISVQDYKGTYCRLIDETTQQGKKEMFLSRVNRFTVQSERFSNISGMPIVYWMGNAMLYAFTLGNTIGKNYRTLAGSSTGDNGRFLKLWFEVYKQKIGFNITEDYDGYGFMWIPCLKGGSYRKWYGNYEYIMNWNNNGEEIKYWVTHNPNDSKTKSWSRRLFNTDLYFHSSITWSKISTGSFSARFMPEGFIMESASCGIKPNKEDIKAILALLNSSLVQKIIEILNPTINVQVGDIMSIPLIDYTKEKTKIDEKTDENLLLSKTDWDSFETSWDFKQHPLISCLTKNQNQISDPSNIALSDCYKLWETECDERFNQLKSNEEELNRIFIDIYGLQEELTPEVADKDVTVRKADQQREVKSLISYAVGCMFGRYSLDVEGLAYAGGVWDKVNCTVGAREDTLGDKNKYISFLPDRDNMIPITEKK